jgi:hypothetical protein
MLGIIVLSGYLCSCVNGETVGLRVRNCYVVEVRTDNGECQPLMPIAFDEECRWLKSDTDARKIAKRYLDPTVDAQIWPLLIFYDEDPSGLKYSRSTAF